MFCPECGTKNEKGAAFCEKCGTKLEEEKSTNTKSSTKKESTTKKPMSKQNKMIILFSSIAVVLIIVVCCVFSSLTKPENIVKKYMKARVANDYSTLYKYEVNIENGDKTFVSETVYKSIMEQNKSKKILNYTVGIAQYDLGKLTSTVPVNYTEEGSTDAKELKIKMKKTTKKSYLFFDNWVVSDAYAESSLIKDYTISVPTGAKVVYGGVEVPKSYLNKDKSSSSTDVYVLSQVFSVKTPIKVTLKNGIVSDDTVTPSSYSDKYTFNLSSDNISEKMKESIAKQAMKDLNDMYDGLIAGTEFEKLTNKNFDKKLKTSYDSFKSRISSLSYKLNSVKYTKTEMTRLSSLSDGTVRVTIKGTYDYSLTYNEKEVKKSDYYYSYLTYDLNGDTYKLMNVESLPTYFSKY